MHLRVHVSPVTGWRTALNGMTRLRSPDRWNTGQNSAFRRTIRGMAIQGEIYENVDLLPGGMDRRIVPTGQRLDRCNQYCNQLGRLH